MTDPNLLNGVVYQKSDYSNSKTLEKTYKIPASISPEYACLFSPKQKVYYFIYLRYTVAH